MFIDTHCHLSVEDYNDISKVILENRENSIDKIIISGCTKDSIKESITYSEKYNDVYLTLGYHPSEASTVTLNDLKYLEENIKSFKVVGIGEIGLDYHYGNENKEEQIKLFEEQLSLALKYNLPVVIHSRDATLDTINVLKKYPKVYGVIHCFSGSYETALEYINMGYYLGIGGVITFKNSKLIDVVKKIGLDNIVLETDAPYLTPEPFRGKINSSKYIPIIASYIASNLNISIEEVSKKLLNNTNCLFDFDRNL